MRDLDVRILHRVRGRAALLRSLRSLLLRVHRYHRARATTDVERRWCACLADHLKDAIVEADPGSLTVRRTP